MNQMYKLTTDMSEVETNIRESQAADNAPLSNKFYNLSPSSPNPFQTSDNSGKGRGGFLNMSFFSLSYDTTSMDYSTSLEDSSTDYHSSISISSFDDDY